MAMRRRISKYASGITPKPVSNVTLHCFVPPVSPATTARKALKEVYRSRYPYLTYLWHLSFRTIRPELIFPSSSGNYAFRSSQAASWHHLFTSCILALFGCNGLKKSHLYEKTPFLRNTENQNRKKQTEEKKTRHREYIQYLFSRRPKELIISY